MGSDFDLTPARPEHDADAFLEFGKGRIPEIHTLIERSIPYCKAFQIFWNGTTYHFIFEEELNQRWATLHQTELLPRVQQLLAAADPQRQFPDYPVALLFGHGETVLFQDSAAPEESGDLSNFSSWRWRLAPWIALQIGGIWLTVVLLSSRGNVRWREAFPAVSLIAAGFFLFAVNRWFNNVAQPAPESNEDQPQA